MSGGIMRRILLWGGGTIVVLVGLFAALAFAYFQTFYPAPPKADYPKPHSLREAQLQDLDYFKHYLDYNKAGVFRYFGPKTYGFSIRCIKDN